MITDPLIPPRWTYNPSSWTERLWLIGVALLGTAISDYLAIYQWEPIGHCVGAFFDSESEVVLRAALSRMLPIPGAALGAFAYGGTRLPELSAAPGSGAPCLGSCCCSGWPWGGWVW